MTTISFIWPLKFILRENDIRILDLKWHKREENAGKCNNSDYQLITNSQI